MPLGTTAIDLSICSNSKVGGHCCYICLAFILIASLNQQRMLCALVPQQYDLLLPVAS